MTARNVSRPSATVCRAGIAQKQCQSCGRCSPDAHTTMHAPRGFVPAAAATAGGIAGLIMLTSLYSANPTVRAEGGMQPLPGVECVNPVISSGRYEERTVPPHYRLVQAHVHQRHMDRWMYRHDLIENKCWRKQIDSRTAAMAAQCDYNLSSVWEHIDRERDPYAAPAAGNCNARQLTRQGVDHAERLGAIFRSHFIVKHKLVALDCPAGSVGLECDQAQKNQITTQEEYRGLCGRLPTPHEYPADTVLDRQHVAKGTPFWLSLSICGGEELAALEDESNKAKRSSRYWTRDMQGLARDVAEHTGHQVPHADEYAEMLDNVIDCVVCHACHGLDDVPAFFAKVFSDMDRLETADRGYPFTYLAHDKARLARFAQLYYGYYFYVLLDRMTSATQSGPARALYIQVTSDGQITPQLRMLGLDVGSFRPPWGSTLIYELYFHQESEGHFVRVLYNGVAQAVVEDMVEGQLCRWDDFARKLAAWIPDKSLCAKFYDFYTSITITPPQAAKHLEPAF